MTETSARRPSLTSRVIVNIVLLFLMTVCMGLITLWFAGRFDKMMINVTGQGLNLLQASRIMETELANKKGFATYYFLDNDSKWLQELRLHRQQFVQAVERASALDQSPEQAALLRQIRKQHEDYVRGKDSVIELYQTGRHEQGAALHWQVREEFFELNELCRDYRRLSEDQIQAARDSSRDTVRQVMMTIIGLIVVQLLLSIWLLFRLFSNVIIPIRQLSRKTRASDEWPEGSDDIRMLKENVYGLLDDVDRTRDELQQSKEMLLHSEKMALVGKLAPVVAHSIRNPMTSINMRLFSLQRGLSLTDTQQEDFEVVSEEMRRLDHIVQNFLEFSRPHKLRKQIVSVPEVMDKTLELLSYRLDLYNISVIREQEAGDLFAEADPELLKEVFVNLFVNACDAMENGGRLMIVEKAITRDHKRRMILVAVTDTGPGMSEEMQARVLKPFETTKADGTGLGLFIVARIIEEHGGTLSLQSEEGKGTTFTITIPGLEEEIT